MGVYGATGSYVQRSTLTEKPDPSSGSVLLLMSSVCAAGLSQSVIEVRTELSTISPPYILKLVPGLPTNGQLCYTSEA